MILKYQITKQQEQSDCGIACLATIIKYYGGGNKSFESLRELSGTNKQGTTLLGLFQSAQSLGFNVQGEETNIEELKGKKNPVILHVVIEKRLLHYVVCYAFENDKFTIGNPATGIEYWSEEELLEKWQSKALLDLVPNENFVKSEETKKEKKLWFLSLIKEDYGILFSSFAVSILVAVLGLALAIFSQKLIDDILPHKNIEKLVIGLVALCLLLLIRIAFSYAGGFLGIKQSKDFNNRLINRFYGSLLYLPKSFFDNRRIGELVARMEDTGRIQSTIAMVFTSLFGDVILFFVAEVFLFIYSPTIGFFSLATIPIFAFISYRYYDTIVKHQRELMVANANKSSNYVNTMQGIDTIKISQKEKQFEDLNKIIYGGFQEKAFSLGKISISLNAILGIVNVFITIAMVGISAFMVINKKITIGEFMAILSISGMALSSVISLSFANISLQGAKVAFDRMFEFTNIKSEFQAEENNKEITFETLEIKDLSFRFRGRKLLLKDINFEVQKGKTISIIGECGAGKTTILNILQRFYTPSSGEILLNDNNFFDSSISSWRKIIGVVPQESNIFNGTLLDNLCLGGTKEDYENVIKYCKDSGFEKYFIEFPQSYATILGEEGINISGGQKQLIAIARVLYRNPQVLILDEPTSNMDKNTENFILDLLQKNKHNTATIIVTHNIKVARKSDYIHVFANGTIIDRGTHEELLERENLYSMAYREIV